MLLTITAFMVITLFDPPPARSPRPRKNSQRSLIGVVISPVTMPPLGMPPMPFRSSNRRKGASFGTLPARLTRSGSSHSVDSMRGRKSS